MPTPTTQITTNTTVKSLLGITASTDDTLLSLMCDWLTAFIQNYCDKKFVEQTVTNEIYSSRDFKFSFYLLSSPIKSVTSFAKKQSDGSFKALVVDQDYEIELSSGYIQMNQIDNGLADLKITYITLENIPKDIEMVATQLVARAYNKRKSEGVSQESVGEATIQWGALLTDADKAVLNGHRRFTSVIA
jgi:hypothetical protein